MKKATLKPLPTLPWKQAARKSWKVRCAHKTYMHTCVFACVFIGHQQTTALHTSHERKQKRETTHSHTQVHKNVLGRGEKPSAAADDRATHTLTAVKGQSAVAHSTEQTTQDFGAVFEAKIDRTRAQSRARRGSGTCRVSINTSCQNGKEIVLPLLNQSRKNYPHSNTFHSPGGVLFPVSLPVVFVSFVTAACKGRQLIV